MNYDTELYLIHHTHSHGDDIRVADSLEAAKRYAVEEMCDPEYLTGTYVTDFNDAVKEKRWSDALEAWQTSKEKYFENSRMYEEYIDINSTKVVSYD